MGTRGRTEGDQGEAAAPRFGVEVPRFSGPGVVSTGQWGACLPAGTPPASKRARPTAASPSSPRSGPSGGAALWRKRGGGCEAGGGRASPAGPGPGTKSDGRGGRPARREGPTAGARGDGALTIRTAGDGGTSARLGRPAFEKPGRGTGPCADGLWCGRPSAFGCCPEATVCFFLSLEGERPKSNRHPGKGTTGNDPSAGSPTETLLRLLLPLDSQV